jgi:hypothetical protein
MWGNASPAVVPSRTTLRVAGSASIAASWMRDSTRRPDGLCSYSLHWGWHRSLRCCLLGALSHGNRRASHPGLRG